MGIDRLAWAVRAAYQRQGAGMEHLPEGEQTWVARKMEEAWHDPNPDRAPKSLKTLATRWTKITPGPHGVCGKVSRRP